MDLLRRLTDPALKRLYKFVLKRLIGRFLLSELNLSDLNVHLRAGTMELCSLTLDADAINEMLLSSGASCHVVAACPSTIGRIKVRLCYSDILNESLTLELEDIALNLAPGPPPAPAMPPGRAVHGNDGGLNDLDSSKGGGGTSVVQPHHQTQAAAAGAGGIGPACDSAPSDDYCETDEQSREGLDFIASWIDQVLSKIKIRVTNLTLLFSRDHVGSSMPALRVRLAHLQFADEDRTASSALASPSVSKSSGRGDDSANSMGIGVPDLGSAGLSSLRKGVEFRGLVVELSLGASSSTASHVGMGTFSNQACAGRSGSTKRPSLGFAAGHRFVPILWSEAGAGESGLKSESNTGVDEIERPRESHVAGDGTTSAQYPDSKNVKGGESASGDSRKSLSYIHLHITGMGPYADNAAAGASGEGKADGLPYVGVDAFLRQLHARLAPAQLEGLYTLICPSVTVPTSVSRDHRGGPAGGAMAPRGAVSAAMTAMTALAASTPALWGGTASNLSISGTLDDGAPWLDDVDAEADAEETDAEMIRKRAEGGVTFSLGRAELSRIDRALDSFNHTAQLQRLAASQSLMRRGSHTTETHVTKNDRGHSERAGHRPSFGEIESVGSACLSDLDDDFASADENEDDKETLPGAMAAEASGVFEVEKRHHAMGKSMYVQNTRSHAAVSSRRRAVPAAHEELGGASLTVPASAMRCRVKLHVLRFRVAMLYDDPSWVRPESTQACGSDDEARDGVDVSTATQCGSIVVEGADVSLRCSMLEVEKSEVHLSMQRCSACEHMLGCSPRPIMTFRSAEHETSSKKAPRSTIFDTDFGAGMRSGVQPQVFFHVVSTDGEECSGNTEIKVVLAPTAFVWDPLLLPRLARLLGLDDPCNASQGKSLDDCTPAVVTDLDESKSDVSVRIETCDLRLHLHAVHLNSCDRVSAPVFQQESVTLAMSDVRIECARGDFGQWSICFGALDGDLRAAATVCPDGPHRFLRFHGGTGNVSQSSTRLRGRLMLRNGPATGADLAALELEATQCASTAIDTARFEPGDGVNKAAAMAQALQVDSEGSPEGTFDFDSFVRDSKIGSEWLTALDLPSAELDLNKSQYALLMDLLPRLFDSGEPSEPAARHDSMDCISPKLPPASALIVSVDTGTVILREMLDCDCVRREQLVGTPQVATYAVSFQGLEVGQTMFPPGGDVPQSCESVAKRLKIRTRDVTIFESEPDGKTNIKPVLYRTKWDGAHFAADDWALFLSVESSDDSVPCPDTLVHFRLRGVTFRYTVDSSWLFRMIDIMFGDNDDATDQATSDRPCESQSCSTFTDQANVQMQTNVTRMFVDVDNAHIDYVPLNINGRLVIRIGKLTMASTLVERAVTQAYHFAVHDLVFFLSNTRGGFDVEDAMVCGAERLHDRADATSGHVFMYGSTQQFLDQNSFVQVGALDLVEVELVNRDEDRATGHGQTGGVCEIDADVDEDEDDDPKTLVSARCSTLRLYTCADSAALLLGLTSAWWQAYSAPLPSDAPRPPLAKDIHEPADLDAIYAPVSSLRTTANGLQGSDDKANRVKGGQSAAHGQNKERSILEGIDENAFGTEPARGTHPQPSLDTVTPVVHGDKSALEGQDGKLSGVDTGKQLPAFVIDDYYCMGSGTDSGQGAGPGSTGRGSGEDLGVLESSAPSQQARWYDMAQSSLGMSALDGFEAVSEDEEDDPLSELPTVSEHDDEKAASRIADSRESSDSVLDNENEDDEDDLFLSTHFGNVVQSDGVRSGWWSSAPAPAPDVELDDLPASSMAQSMFFSTHQDAVASDDLSRNTNEMAEMFKSAHQGDADLSSSMFLSAHQGSSQVQFELDFSGPLQQELSTVLSQDQVRDQGTSLEQVACPVPAQPAPSSTVSAATESAQDRGPDASIQRRARSVSMPGEPRGDDESFNAFVPEIAPVQSEGVPAEQARWFSTGESGSNNGAVPQLHIFPHHISIPLASDPSVTFGASEARAARRVSGARSAATSAGQTEMRFILSDLRVQWRLFGGEEWDTKMSPHHVEGNEEQRAAKAKAKREGRVLSQSRCVDERSVEGKANVDTMRRAALLDALLDDYDPLEHGRRESTSGHSAAERGSSAGAARRGRGRIVDEMIELDLIGLKIRFDSFAGTGHVLSNMVVGIKDLHVEDRIKVSAIRRMLGYWQDDIHHPRLDGTDVLWLQLVTHRPGSAGLSPTHGANDTGTITDDEYRLRLRFLPLRLNVDQLAAAFLVTFGRTFSAAMPAPPPSALEALPMFFQTCDVRACKVKVDYQPQRVDLDALRSGQLAELLNLSPLEGMELVLQQVKLTGITGWDGLLGVVLESWLDDIVRRQLHKCVASVSLPPLRAATNVGAGAADLVLLPLQQYRRDGRVVCGIRRGCSAFVRSLAIETLGLGSKLARGAEAVLHATDDLFAPDDARGSDGSTSSGVRANVTTKSTAGPQLGDSAGIREGVKAAAESVTRGVQSAAHTIIAVPLQEYARTGTGGAVRSVVRAVPVAVLHPILGVTRAVSHVMHGAANQMLHADEARDRALRSKQ